jgi:hypothetical protein
LDGDVQGFRFAVSEDSADATQPRGAAAFAPICAHTPAKAGTKRVALVLDFGTAADAPSGETPPARRTACARVSPDATTADALAAVAKPLRYDTNALLCAIAGYPQKGCGEQVSTQPNQKQKPASTNPAPTPHHGPSVGLWAGAGAVILLAGAALWRSRRHKDV